MQDIIFLVSKNSSCIDMQIFESYTKQMIHW